MTYGDLLVQKAKLEKSTITRSATGEEIDTWVVQFTNVPVLVRFARQESDVPIGLEEQVTHLIHVEPMEELLTGRWRAIVDGREYRLVDIRNPGQRGHHYEVFARRWA